MAPETIVAALRRWASLAPERPAYHLLGESNEIADSLSYATLDRRARSIAAQLATHRLPPDACAVLLYPEGPDFIAAFMGCLYAGIIAVPAPFPGALRSMQDGRRLQAILADSQAALLLTTVAGSQLLDGSTPALLTDGLDEGNGESWEPTIDEQGIAYIQYTSGSTAAPKGIVVTHTSLAHSLAGLHNAWGYDANSAALTWMPHVHDYGLLEGLLRPLSGGIPCTILSPWAFVRRPVRWLQAISRYRITHSGGATFAYDWCVRQIAPEKRQELDLSTWQVAVIGAEPIQPAVIERFTEAFGPCGFRQETFCPGYGLAEGPLIATAKLKGSSLALRHVMVGAHSAYLTSCGQPPDAGRVLIVDPETRRSCATGEVGEIWVSGPSVAGGYWRRSAEIQEIFHAYLAESNEGPFLRTGDLGLLDQGELFITGRLKDMIIIRGQNYYPQDIEWALAGCHPAVEGQLAAAFGVPIENGEQIVIAQEVDPRRWPEATWKEVIAAIRQRVAEQFELPVQGIVLLRRGDLPKTSSGKLQRHACQIAYLAREWQPVAVWQKPEVAAVEEDDLDGADLVTRLTTIWQVILHTPVGPEDNFFELGGDSLTALRMTLAVEEATGQSVPAEFFRTATVAHLAQLLVGDELVKVDNSPPKVGRLHERQRLPFVARQRLRHQLIDVGPVWHGHALPYGLGVRLQRAWLALPGLRERLFGRQIQVLRRWSEMVGEPLSEEAIQCSLLINTWRDWRRHALGVPLGTSRWVTMLGDPALWRPQTDGPGTIFLVMHTQLGLIFMRGLEKYGHKVWAIRSEMGGWEVQPQERTIVLHQGYEALQRGETVVIAGDGGKGGQGVVMPFFGGRRIFRQGAAELAVQTGARLIPVFCTMATDGRVAIEVKPPLTAGHGASEVQVERLTRTYAEQVVARWTELYPTLNWRNLEVWLGRLERGKM